MWIVLSDLQIGNLKTTDVLTGDFDKIFHCGVNHETGNFDCPTTKRTHDACCTGVFDARTVWRCAGTWLV